MQCLAWTGRVCMWRGGEVGCSVCGALHGVGGCVCGEVER